MAIHQFFAAEKPRDGAGARSACFPPSSKASAPVPVRFAAGYLLFAELQNGRFSPSVTEAAYKIPVKRQKVGQKCGQIAATGRKIIEKKIII